MKRFLTLVLPLIILGLLACDKKTYPQKPQILLCAGSQTCSGTAQPITLEDAYIGTKPQASLKIENGGLDTLVISSASIAGDSVFTIEGPLKTELKGLEHTFLRIFFAPTAEKTYSAVITINSNAENGGQKTVNVSAKGVKP